MDAKYKINSTGMLLIGVLAEFDGTVFPLAYLFVEKDTSDGIVSNGSMTYVLDQFLRPQLESELDPSFSVVTKKTQR